MGGSHGVRSQFLDQRQEDKPLLDLVHESNVGVASLVNLHVLKSLEEFLDLIFHGHWVGLNPLGLHVSVEVLLAVSDVVPEDLHVSDFGLDGLNRLDRVVNHTSVSELLGLETVVGDSLVEVIHLTVD